MNEPEHKVQVVMTSQSGERLNQRVTFEEFADTSEELKAKNIPLAAEVVNGIMVWAAEAAE